MPRVLLTSTWLPCNMGRILRQGFIEAGAEVVTAGPWYGRWIPWANGMLLKPEYVYKPDIELPRDGTLTLSNLMDRGGAIDAVVQSDPYWFLKVDRPSIPNVHVAADNHVLTTPEADQYDLIFGAHSWGTHSDSPKFRWCPAGAESWAKDLGRERPVDVCMIGNIYESRMHAIQTIFKNMPYTVLAGLGPIEGDFNELYNMAKIALVVSCNGDLTHRVMNNLASGALVIMDSDVKDAEKIGLRDCIHYMGYADELQMIERIRQAIDEPQVRKVITTRAKEWVKGHAFASRCSYIIEQCGLVAQAKGAGNAIEAG